ncbi:MAG: hypothetical protein WCE63_15055 [Acidobacteriaceae bacterium]
MPRYLAAQQFGRPMKLSFWAWLLWSIPFNLVLEVAPFLIAGGVLKKTVGELVGPYLAFAVPSVIIMSLVWWLRIWEQEGISPKRLARGWGLSIALFGVTVTGASFYSGVALRLMDPKDALGGFVATILLSVPISYFGMSRRALRTISKRAAGKLDGSGSTATN